MPKMNSKKIEYNPEIELAQCVLRIAKEPLKMNISQRDLCVQFYTFIENYLDSPQVRDYEKLVGRCSELRKVKLVLYDYLTDTQDIEL